jgi:hypothetical protein
LVIDGLGSLGYDRVKRMQTNCIPYYQEGEIAKVVREHIGEAIFNNGWSII